MNKEEGFATVLTASVVAVLSVIALSLVSLAMLFAARAQVQRAADLVALASAPIHEQAPCEVAAEVARYNKVSLSECDWREGEVKIVVDRPTGLVLVPKLTAHASAKTTIRQN